MYVVIHFFFVFFLLFILKLRLFATECIKNKSNNCFVNKMACGDCSD